jgi:DNA-directed RNA polymerase specialized sigma24 family protein
MIPEVQEESGWETVVGTHDLWLRRRVRDGMRRLGLRPRPDEVGESVQEVYCRLLQGGPRRLRRLRAIQRNGILTYLGRVADSVLLDEMRAAKAAKRGGGPIARLQRFDPPDADPEGALLKSEGERILMRHLLDLADREGLTRRDVRILWLAVVEEWRSRDLARAFELTPRYVDTLLHRVRRQLRRRLRTWSIIPPCASSPTPDASSIARPAAIPSGPSGSRGS